MAFHDVANAMGGVDDGAPALVQAWEGRVGVSGSEGPCSYDTHFQAGQRTHLVQAWEGRVGVSG